MGEGKRLMIDTLTWLEQGDPDGGIADGVDLGRDPAGRVITRRWCSCGSLESLVDANGNVTYTVYDDVNREVRVYGGWDDATDMPTGATWATMEGWAERGGGLADGHGNSVPRFHITWGTGPGVLEPFVARVRAIAGEA